MEPGAAIAETFATQNAPAVSFDGKYAAFSNFTPSPMTIEGIIYPTLEHAFQAHKTLNPERRRRIAAIPKPGKAKAAGRALPLREDWEQVKQGVMKRLLLLKFADSRLRELLLSTGTARLVHRVTWNDTYWGVRLGRGENHLGRLLMEVRDELRRVRAENAPSVQGGNEVR